jgi:hypothetical protein
MTEQGSILGQRLRVELPDVDRWSRTHLGAGVNTVLFCEGHLSTVHLGLGTASWAATAKGQAGVLMKPS